MARRTRSFLFDNISKRLVQNTNKTAKEINTRRAANTVANTDILTSLETDTKISTTISNTGINTLSDISIANVVSDQVLQYNANTGNWENETLSLVSSVDGLTDTSLSNVQRDDYLKYDGSNWINSALDLSSYVTDTDIAAYSNTAQMNTAIASSNTAMKNYVDAEVAGVVNSAPSTLDTLNELAAALGDDPDFATTTATNIGTKLAKSSNLSDLTNAATARTNLGLGTAATTASTDYATSAQGTKADTAHGWGNHASAGYGTSNFSGAYADLSGKPSLFSGSYNDLSNKPTIPTNTNQLTNGSGYITGITSSMVTTALGFTPGTSSFSGSYNDLSNKPTIPTNNNQLTNGAGYITSSSLSGYQPRTLQQSSRNLVFATGSTGAGGIFLEKSNGSPLIQLYSDGTNYGFLWGEWGGWDIKKADGGPLYIDISGTLREVYHTGNLPTIPTNNNQLTNGAGYITNGANYNVNNVWLRENGDNAHVQLYGNTRQMVFRTDGTTEYSSGVGGYPFVWMYGGNGAAERKMMLGTGGQLQTYSYQGHSNVSGTGNASYHPSGVYSTGTNWLYGTIHTNNNAISAGTGAITCGAITASGVIDANAGAGAINITNSDIRSSASSNWTGNPGANGKIQYHSNRWYIVADSSSNRIVQFRRDGSDKSYIDNNGTYIGNISGSAGSVAWGNVSGKPGLVETTYNSSLNGDSRNSRGVTRLYRRDSNSDYSVQTYWTGSYWRLYGYYGDSNHADTHVGYADRSNTVTINYNNNSNASYQLLWGSGNSVYGTGSVYLNPSTNYVYATSFVTASDWFRTTGTGGVYFGSYGGGWHMTDSTWIRVYNGKAVYATNTIATSANICAYYSDERLKTITGHIDNALDKVLSIDGFYYVENELAKELGYNNDKQQVGVSAQKVQAVLPEAVELAPVDYETTEDGEVISKSGENYLTVDYSKMVPLLIEAIKEQQKQIEELKEKVK